MPFTFVSSLKFGAKTVEPKKKQEVRKEYVVKEIGHTHMGEPCKVGDKIKLRMDQAVRLEKRGIV